MTIHDDDTARIATARIESVPAPRDTADRAILATRWPFVVVCCVAPFGFVAGVVGWHVMLALMVISVLVR